MGFVEIIYDQFIASGFFSHCIMFPVSIEPILYIKTVSVFTKDIVTCEELLTAVSTEQLVR